MQHFKRLISFLLAALLLVQCFPASAGALWICAFDNIQNDDNFCKHCGRAREESYCPAWTCPNDGMVTREGCCPLCGLMRKKALSAPAAAPAPEAAAAVTDAPTAAVTEEPTAAVTEEPTAAVTEEPTAVVTEEPTAAVTDAPTAAVTDAPTAVVTEEPTAAVTDAPTDTPAPEAAAQAVSEQITAGETICFGAYTQSENGKGRSAIRWIVAAVDEENHRALLVSRYGLNIQPYNNRDRNTTWENSSLRTWLNSTFLYAAFSVEEEQAAILTAEVVNGDTQGCAAWSTDGGADTKDELFLLSCADLEQYGVPADCELTDYAATLGGDPAGAWWLRCPGEEQNQAAYILPDGSPGCGNVTGTAAVRPAMWVDTDSEPMAYWTCLFDGQGNHGDYCSLCGKTKAKAAYGVGTTLTFGTCAQTEDGKDSTPIEWLVLERDGTQALVISRYALDCQPYNSAQKAVTWAGCSLRKWLNNTFIGKAFTTKERGGIQVTEVSNGADQGASGYGDGGNDTKDKIFLLSYAEANKYFGSDEAGQCAVTDYALSRGADTFDASVDGLPVGNWWLRSPGEDQTFAMTVGAWGKGESSVSITTMAVRPALWIDLTVLTVSTAKRKIRNIRTPSGTNQPAPTGGETEEPGEPEDPEDPEYEEPEDPEYEEPEDPEYEEPEDYGDEGDGE